jgi:hypothetical protein
MSLASQTAKTASNMNLALTLNWFVRELEDSRKARVDLPIDTALDMINMHLTELEQERVRLINDERVKRELANDKTLAEVLS